MKLMFLQPDVWGSTGPRAVTRVMMKACGKYYSMSLMKHFPFSCANVTIYPQPYFFPHVSVRDILHPFSLFESKGRQEFEMVS